MGVEAFQLSPAKSWNPPPRIGRIWASALYPREFPKIDTMGIWQNITLKIHMVFQRTYYAHSSLRMQLHWIFFTVYDFPPTINTHRVENLTTICQNIMYGVPTMMWGGGSWSYTWLIFYICWTKTADSHLQNCNKNVVRSVFTWVSLGWTIWFVRGHIGNWKKIWFKKNVFISKSTPIEKKIICRFVKIYRYSETCILSEVQIYRNVGLCSY